MSSSSTLTNLFVLLLVIPTFLSCENNKLRNCLRRNGIAPSKFISRDNISELEIYNHLNYQWNTRTGIIQPLGYFLPTETLDVQMAVICGKQLNISIVAKGGGHSHEKYSFGDSSSVILDLQMMSQIKIDQEIAQVGGGVLMGKLAWSLWEGQGQGRRYAVPTTDCPIVGIGGATLSGGFGVWSKRWGMLSDNVVEMQMVDANGKVFKANAVNNTDLFWALRDGGGGNFGIVTQFTYKLIDVTNVRVTFIEFIYNFNDFSIAVQAWLNFIQKRIEDPIHSKICLEAGGQIVIYVIDLDMDPLEIESVRNSFPPNSTSFKVVTYNFIEYVATKTNPSRTIEELANITRHEYPHHSTRVKTYFSTKIVNKTQIEDLNSICSEIPKGVFLYINSWGGQLNQIQRNATAFVHRNHLFFIHVSRRVDDVEAEDWMKLFDSAIAANQILNSTEGLQTLVDEELENYLDYYYGENLERLVQIKKDFDPDNYFNFAQSIPTELPNVKRNK